MSFCRNARAMRSLTQQRHGVRTLVVQASRLSALAAEPSSQPRPFSFPVSRMVLAPRCYSVAVTAADIEQRVLAVCNAFEIITKDVSLISHFQNDFGLDSLDLVELVMKMEDEFGFEIPDRDAERFLTPADIVKYLCEKEEVQK